jgi:PIN domain-containing protein
VSWAVDTNVLLRMVDVGQATQPVAELAVRILGHNQPLRIFPQTLIEFWAVATRPRINNGLELTISDTSAQLEKLKRMFVLLADTAEVFAAWERIVSSYQVVGKQAHDAHIVASMHGVTHLLTFNDADFKRYSEIIVVNPQTISEEETK